MARKKPRRRLPRLAIVEVAQLRSINEELDRLDTIRDCMADFAVRVTSAMEQIALMVAELKGKKAARSFGAKQANATRKARQLAAQVGVEQPQTNGEGVVLSADGSPVIEVEE